MGIDAKYLDKEYLRQAGLDPMSAQYIYDLAYMGPDWTHSAIDPELLKIIEPAFERLYSRVETYLEKLHATNEYNKQDPDKLIFGPPPVIDPNEPYVQRYDNGAVRLKAFLEAMDCIKGALGNDLQNLVEAQKNKFLSDNHNTDIHNKGFSNDQVLKATGAMIASNSNYIGNGSINYAISYYGLNWDDVGPKHNYQITDAIIKACSKSLNDSPRLDPEEIRRKYGLAYITFSELYYTDETRQACLRNFVEAADFICRKMRYTDPAMFGQVGELGLNFTESDGASGGSYSTTKCKLNISGYITPNAFCHEYGHRLDHVIGLKAFEGKVRGYANYTYASSKATLERNKVAYAIMDNDKVTDPILYKAMLDISKEIDPGDNAKDTFVDFSRFNKSECAGMAFNCALRGDVVGMIASLTDMSNSKYYWSEKVELFARHFSTAILQDNNNLLLGLQKKSFVTKTAMKLIGLKDHSDAFDQFCSTVGTQLNSHYTEALMQWKSQYVPARYSNVVLKKESEFDPDKTIRTHVSNLNFGT